MGRTLHLEAATDERRAVPESCGLPERGTLKT